MADKATFAPAQRIARTTAIKMLTNPDGDSHLIVAAASVHQTLAAAAAAASGATNADIANQDKEGASNE